MDILLPVLLSAPVWLLLAVGVVYGLMTRAAHRRVSLLASAALAGFLALDVTGTLVSLVYFNLGVGQGGLQSLVVRAFFLVQAGVHGLLLTIAISAVAVDRADPGQEAS